MAQHFALSPSALGLSIESVYAMDETEAFEEFVRLRYADNDGDPVCPWCGSVAVNRYRARRIFKCKGCQKQFSPTSDTVFAHRKLPYRKLLVAISLACLKNMSMSAIDLRKMLGTHYRTAFALGHKIREAMGREAQRANLEGAVEADVKFVGGHIRPKNVRKTPKDRPKVPYQNFAKRVVIGAAREKTGSRRVKVCQLVQESDLVPFVHEIVFADTELHTDGADAFGIFSADYDHRVAIHKEFYSCPDACTNQVESYFSMLADDEGIHCSISKQHALLYGYGAAWRASHLNESPLKKRLALMRNIGGGKSGMAGYWQGKKALWVLEWQLQRLARRLLKRRPKKFKR